ncbi:hypothetical protein [Paludisphaera mucosa]|uniref:Uncharacterized protein n=1 Tax=Paludisphaera mucosa TaxID=3030827 RepID=A0ABT6FH99_9BACT|nr:hypothetical protein [Paludisphaera mucosa]MDG3006961.1 hypothetical protein [Paludisphaera mucosa]
MSGSLLRFIDDGQLEPLRQALSGFNHRCRNLLNSMKMSFYLTKRAATGPLPERWDELNRTYTEVERLFDLIQSIYRSMSLTFVRQPFRAIVDERARSWVAAFQRQGLTLTIEPPAGESTGEFDAMRLSSALDGFIAWRASRLSPGGGAVLSWWTTARHFEVEWREFAAAPLDASPPGPTSPHAALASTTQSLSLPLLARVVSEHRGRLDWTPRPDAEARLRWPLSVAESAAAAADVTTAVSHASLAPSFG